MSIEHHCRSCDSTNLETFLDLGVTPLADGLLREEHLTLEEPTYPLEVAFCNDCGLMQILETVIPVFLIILISYLIDKKRKINLDPLIDVAIYITTPALVFSAIQKHELVLTNFFKIALSAVVIFLPA